MMKKYTDGTRVVEARPMLDTEYFRDFDGDPNYQNSEPKTGMFVVFENNGLRMSYAFYPSQEKFLKNSARLKNEQILH